MSRLRSPLVPAAILAAGALAVALPWLREVQHRQKAIEITMIAGGLTVVALTAWFGRFAPFSPRVRRGVAGSVLGLAVLAGVLLRIEGTSGDLVPRLAWRWAAPRDAAMADVGVESAAVPDPGVSFAFLGERRDGAVDTGLSRDWAARPPKLLWKREIGAGWSGFAVAKGRAVTQEQRGPSELVVAYGLLTGAPLWKHADEARFDTVLGGVGPRATPAIDGDRVYAFGATGILNCLELETGKRVWSVDVARETGAPRPDYGFSSTPLVDGPRVIVHPGALVAYDKATGKRIWASGSERPAYASPSILTLAGRRQLVALNWASCAGHDPETGAPLWRYEWRGEFPKAAQPLGIGADRVAISGGYSLGTDAFKVTASGVEPAWSSRHLMAKFSSFVIREGHLYGLNDGVLACVNAETGVRTWRGAAYGHGQLILAGDLLVISAEDGRAALVEATPSAFRELGAIPAVSGKAWNHPALAGPYLLMRSDREAACLELPR